MKILIDVNALERVGERLNEVWSTLQKYDRLRPITPFLPQNEDEGDGEDIVIDRAAAMSLGRERDGFFEITTPIGVISLSWSYHAKAWFQGVSGELNACLEDLPAITDAVGELSETLLSAYSVVELQDIRNADVARFSGKGFLDDPWDCLDDLYWSNYFGPELTRILRDVHGLQFDGIGLRQQSLGRGWEVRVDGPPKQRPYPAELERYLTNSRVFRKYCSKARFETGRVEFDYSRVRRSSK